MRNELNMSYLRAADGQARRSEPVGSDLSRRQFLQAGGALALAAAGMQGALSSLGRAMAGHVEVLWNATRVALRLAGAERWVIDTRQFGGAPRLAVTETDEAIRIALAGATYPGTGLPADLTAELARPGAAGLMRLRLKLGRFDAQVRLTDWLSGDQSARSRVDLNGWFTPVTGGELRLAGTARATFGPDWQLRLTGSGIATLATASLSATGAALTLAVQPADAPSLLQHATDRRTLVTLGRGGDPAWNAWPALAELDSAGLKTEANPFTTIELEAMETQKGIWRQGLLALTPETAPRPEAQPAPDSQPAALSFHPGDAFTHPDGTAARLPLRQPRLALALDPDGHQTALLARFGAEPTWVCTRGCTLQLGDAPSARPLELMTRDGALQRRLAAPAVLSMAAAMPGAIVEPIVATAGEPIVLELAAAGANPGTDPTPAANATAPTLRLDLPGVALIARPAYINVVRPVDMLTFAVRFVNLRLEARFSGTPALLREVPERDSYIVFKFPPQHIAEQAFWLTEGQSDLLVPPPIPSRAAGPTWVAFRIPKSIEAIDYTLESLLQWGNWEHVTVSRVSNPTANDSSGSPFTAIEAPYRLYLSPSYDTYWTHSVPEVTLDGRTELWHTQLAHLPPFRIGRGGYTYNSLRAVWTPDLTPEPPKNDLIAPNTLPFNYAMTARKRFEIVSESAVPLFGSAQPPIRVENLMLSSLGAWLKLEGKWDPLPGMAVTAWRHEAVMGRDQYVKVVDLGYLYPFGHLAVRITETERRIEPNTAGNQGAYLRKSQYILVLERERLYAAPESFSNIAQIKRARNLPLRRVTMLTHATPKLDIPDPAYTVPSLGSNAIWARVAGAYFNFHMVGNDWEGNPVEFSAPLIWVSNSVLTGPGSAPTPGLVQAEYAKDAARRTANLKGQRVAYAPRVPLPQMPAAGKPGDTLFETAAMTFASAVKEGFENAFPPFFPTLDTASVQIPTLANMTSTKAPQAIKMAEHWLTNGFNAAANPGYLFAEMATPVDLGFGGDKSGGVLTPDMSLGGLSLSQGLVGGAGAGLTDFATGTFDPKQFFGDKAKVLGGLLLSDILGAVNGFTANGDPTVPQITSKVHYPNNNTNLPPDAIDTNLRWTPKVIAFGPLVNYYNPDPDKDANAPGSVKSTALVTANMHTPFKNPAGADWMVHGELNNFIIDIANCIRLGFTTLAFDSAKGKDLKTDVGLKWVAFEGPLSFVEKLKDSLGNIFGDGFKLDVEPTGVRASFNLPLPNIAVGVFALKNLSVGAGLDLPFIGSQPALVNFHFCSRENPFNLTVVMLGGGGFFGITLGVDGVQSLEIALEFGASVSIDLGVASGGVSIVVGIYFKYDKTEGAMLEGYLKIHGEMTVLLIASLSITLYLSFIYKEHGKCWGQATITVEVRVLFFSASAEVHAERQFSGHPGDPTFSEMVTADQWSNYLGAFA